VVLGMMLRSLVLVMLGMFVMAMRNVRVVSSFFMITCFVVVMRFFVMLCRFCVVVGSFFVVIVL
jgi:hypothetical protein